MNSSTLRTVCGRRFLPMGRIHHYNNAMHAAPSSRPPAAIVVVATSRRYLGSGGGARGARGHGWWVNFRAGKGGRHLQGEYSHLDVEALQAWNDAVFSLGSQMAYLDVRSEPVAIEDVDGSGVGDDVPVYRLKLELATAVLPKATENFIKLIQAEPGIGYSSSTLHRVEKKVGLMGGLVWRPENEPKANPNAVVPVGKCHPDLTMPTSFTNMDVSSEHMVLSHVPGVLTMLSPRVHEIDSRFLLCSHHAPHLDGKSLAIGRLADEDSFEILQQWESSLITAKGRPTNVTLRIAQCGMLDDEETSNSNSTITAAPSPTDGNKMTES